MPQSAFPFASTQIHFFPRASQSVFLRYPLAEVHESIFVFLTVPSVASDMTHPTISERILPTVPGEVGIRGKSDVSGKRDGESA